MRHLVLAAVAAATFAGPVLADPPSWAPANGWRAVQYQDQGDQRERDNQDRWRREHNGDSSGYQRGYYDQQRGDQGRGDPRYGDRRDGDQRYGDRRDGDQRYGDRRDGYQQQNAWYPDQHYKYSRRYQTRYLGQNEQIWRGRDNRYYCRRSDGTAGLIIGGIGGGVLGDAIAPGGSRTLGALLGGGLGAVIGNSIDRNRVQCR